MITNTRTLNDFTTEELHNLIADLQAGVRYNDLKIKYSIPYFTFTTNTISDCKDIIAKREPKNPIIPNSNIEDIPSNLNTWYDEKGELHYGMRPNPAFPWTMPQPEPIPQTPLLSQNWYEPDRDSRLYPSFKLAIEEGTLDAWYEAVFGENYRYERIVTPGISKYFF